VVEVKRGEKFFEWSNHLGNVLATVSDRKIAHSSNSSTIDYYEADIVSAQDYYPFGMIMPGRATNNGNGYQYGFNGQERSTEIGDNSYTAEFWQYDSRIGRRWNIDPVYQHSPYATLANNPISFVDPDGADTINITRTTTRVVGGTIKSNLDNYPSIKIPDRITRTGDINITAAEGNDIFRITDININIDENGNETRTSNTTTLELNNPQTFYQSGGHNMEGYIDDRYALAANAPTWLLQHYDKKSGGDIGIRSAMAYQKTIPFAAGLGKIVNVAYAVFGTTSLIRGVLSMGRGGVAYTTVGRWMSQAELKAMNTTGMIQQGAGGQTFVTTGGASSYMGAARGSVFVEFQVPTKSLLQGGKDGWFKMIGPDASKTMQYQLNKQGGVMLPQFKNLTGILQIK
jgi:RHS repeat-associated protein